MHSQIDKFEAGFNRLTHFCAALVAISIGLMALLIPLSLFLVKFKLGSIWWLNESIEYVLYFGVFIGAPWVLQQGAHVRVDVLTSALPESAARKLDGLINLFGIALCILLCIYGTRAGIAEFIDQTMPDKDVKIANWIVVTVFAFSFLMLAIEFLLRMRNTRVLKIGNDSEVSEGGI
ncbi:MAG: TRAP transporter small permease [Rhodospirillales bacterium]|jgi:TRAP-type C4-dicarboxylate transport system permease small subunit